MHLKCQKGKLFQIKWDVHGFVQSGFSSLADSNWSNDWQKVQYNTDLLKQRHKYLYRMVGVN